MNGRIWLAVGLLSIVGCGPETPRYLTTDTSLGGELRSGIGFRSATTLPSTQQCDWVREEVGRQDLPDGRLLWVLTRASANSCSHLAAEGRLTLAFINDRLMQVDFAANDPSAYRRAVEEEIGREVAGDRSVWIDDVSVHFAEAEGAIVASWINAELLGFMLEGH